MIDICAFQASCQVCLLICRRKRERDEIFDDRPSSRRHDDNRSASAIYAKEKHSLQALHSNTHDVVAQMLNLRMKPFRCSWR